MPLASFTLRVCPETDVLQRVVMICHRRHVEIVSVSYEAEEIRMTVRGDTRRMRQMVQRFDALVNVLAVMSSPDRLAVDPQTGQPSHV